MHENTRLLVLAGVHGTEDGRLGDREDTFVTSCEAQIELLRRQKAEEIEAKNIQFRVVDVGQIDINDTNRRQLDENKFVEEVKIFKPTVLVLAFPWSHKSELNDLLRAAGIYSTLILREDLAQITESRHVHLDEGQEELIRRIAEEEPKNVFLWGSSGTGKTLMLCEALKIKISQLRRRGKKDVRVFVTTMKREGGGGGGQLGGGAGRCSEGHRPLLRQPVRGVQGRGADTVSFDRRSYLKIICRI